MVLPRLLYQVWFQGVNDPSFTSAIRENTDAWKRMNPTWRHQVVDQHRLRQACRSISPETEACFLKLANVHMVLAIDFGRYCLLYETGGMYVDTDMWCIRPLDSCAMLTEGMNQRSDWLAVSLLSIQLFGMRFVNNGMMMSTAKHPFLLALISDIQTRVYDLSTRGTPLSKEWLVGHCTGPVNVRKQLRLFEKNPANEAHAIVYLPHDLFEPRVTEDLFYVTDRTVALHFHEGTWIPKHSLLRSLLHVGREMTLCTFRPLLPCSLLLLGILVGVLLTLLIRAALR